MVGRDVTEVQMEGTMRENDHRLLIESMSSRKQRVNKEDKSTERRGETRPGLSAHTNGKMNLARGVESALAINGWQISYQGSRIHDSTAKSST